MNRPDVHNAMNPKMFEDLQAVLSEVARNERDRVLVLTGAGTSFSSGGDLKGSGDSVPLPRMTMLREVVGGTALALHRFPKPVITAVNGLAMGAGAVLALSGDIVLASDTARFSFIFVQRGLSLDFGGSWILPRLVGLSKAKELAMYGDWLGAEEAREFGVVARVFPAGDFTREVRDWAQRLAERSPTALSMIKQSLNRSLHLSMEEALDVEAMAQTTCATSPEYEAARAAFRARRETPSTRRSD
jgi:2-(1,2-epoxy-1,2-dihydrophenyl)acetyl-CoA isomerase